MAIAPQNCVLEQNFQLLTPLKFGSPVFRVLTEMQNLCRPLWKMGKMAVAPQKHTLKQNFQLPTPLKFGSPVFRVFTETHNWCQPLQKMGKMAIAPQKRVLEQNFQLPTPLNFGSPHESVLEQRFSFYPRSHLCVVLQFLIFSIVLSQSTTISNNTLCSLLTMP